MKSMKNYNLSKTTYTAKKCSVLCVLSSTLLCNFLISRDYLKEKLQYTKESIVPVCLVYCVAFVFSASTLSLIELVFHVYFV